MSWPWFGDKPGHPDGWTAVRAANNKTRFETMLKTCAPAIFGIAGLNFSRSLFVSVAAAGLGVSAFAVDVPNGSFESPQGPFPPPGVSIQIDSWQKSPQPVWFDPAAFGGVQWNQLSGIFPNAPAGDPRHLTNLDGSQVGFFLAVPEVGLSQVLGATFESGMAYNLTLGLRGGGALAAGDTFLAGLFYLDGATPVPIATTSITATAGFATATELTDFGAYLSNVQPGDAWAGKNIGVLLAVTSLNTSGGTAYWEVDKVSVTAVPEPETCALMAVGAALLGFSVWRQRRGA